MHTRAVAHFSFRTLAVTEIIISCLSPETLILLENSFPVLGCTWGLVGSGQVAAKPSYGSGSKLEKLVAVAYPSRENPLPTSMKPLLG